MVKVLNRGLKFSVLPLKLNITQVLADFKRFERTMVWKEYWFGKDKEPYVPPIFKQKKYNFPRNHKAPKGLQNYLAAIKSEIADTMNRHRVKSNITEEEKDALKKLIQFQNDRIIDIKPCDKGAGIIVLDFEEYMRSCTEHLEAQTTTGENYYKQVKEKVLKEAQEKITNIVKEGFNNEILSKEEYSAILPPDKAPPIRGIVSTSGTL